MFEFVVVTEHPRYGRGERLFGSYEEARQVFEASKESGQFHRVNLEQLLHNVRVRIDQWSISY